MKVVYAGIPEMKDEAIYLKFSSGLQIINWEEKVAYFIISSASCFEIIQTLNFLDENSFNGIRKNLLAYFYLFWGNSVAYQLAKCC